jgi:hypothetical protein
MAATPQNLFLLKELKKTLRRKNQLQKSVKLYAIVWGRYTNVAGAKHDKGDVILLNLFDIRFNTKYISSNLNILLKKIFLLF